MNGSEEPVEIEVEPEIQNILPFEDFYIDQFVDYLENDVNGNGHDASSQIGNHQKHQFNNNNNNSHHHKPCNYQCTVCRETLGSGSELLKHVRTHTRMLGSYNQRNLKKHKKCCICMRSFDHPSKLKIHEETQHLPPFRCRYCNSYHTALKYYKMHLKLHQQQQQPQQRRLSSSSHVPEHSSMSSIHHRNNNHHKQSKKSGFKHFYTPQKLTTGNVARLASLAVQTNHHGLPSSSLSPLRCKYCGKLFAKFTTLRKHEMLHLLNGNYQQQYQHHQSSSNNLRINPEVDVVEVNNSASAAESAQKSTALTLTPSLLSNLNKLANLKSSECNDGKKPAILININTNDTPQVETAKMKSQEMPLNSSSGLMISSVSSVDKNYFETIEKQKDSAAATVFIQNGKKAVSLADLQCPICKKIVSQPFSLKVHLRTHTMEKPYSCPVCNKSFSQSCNLKTHMNIHNKHQYNQQPPQSNNNGNPFMCNICNKTFLKASSLNTHMISHTAKLYCYACNINFDDDALTYSQHMQVTHNVIMTKDLISRAKANLQRSESMNQQQQQHETVEEKVNGDEQPRLKEVFQVQSSSAQNGQIPKLKITIKKEPMIKQEPTDGNESDSSSSSSSSSNSSSSSSSSDSSSSSTTNNNNSNDEKNDNNNR